MGAEVEVINLFDLNIQHCTGCVACVNAMFGTGKKICVLKDDFGWLLERMLEADDINRNNSHANEYRKSDDYKAKQQKYKDFITGSKPE